MTKRKQGKLKDEHRAFVVCRLAMYDTPKEAAQALKEEYGIEISPQACEFYDPTKRAGKDLSQRWREMFEQARKDFLDNVEKYVPEANKTVRIQQLAHSARTLRARGNHVAAADMLERIAKELGNVHTNKRELTGKDGAPIKVDYANLSEDEINAKLANALAALGVTVPTEEEAEGGEA